MRRATVVPILLLLLASLAGCGPGSESGTGTFHADIEEGRSLYLSYGCGVCHGKEGEGNGPASASLRTRPRDFHDVASFAGGHTIESIAGTIERGVAEGRTGMIAFPQIPREERMQIAAYIISLGEAPKTQ